MVLKGTVKLFKMRDVDFPLLAVNTIFDVYIYIESLNNLSSFLFE